MSPGSGLLRRASASVLALALLTPAALAAAATAVPDRPVLDFTADERARIASHGPWPVAPRADAGNRVEALPAAQALGRALFFESRWSAGGQISCASCHLPAAGFQDGRALAQGRATGLRNTPGLLDVAQQRWFGWDGANDSLWAASLQALTHPAEVGASAATVAALLRGDALLAAGYRQAFGRPVDEARVLVDAAKALAAWQATLVSPRTAFDDFRDAMLLGDATAAARYPISAQRGLRLFIGRGNCALCHAGPRFSQGEFADIGLPFFTAGGVDGGRHGGIRQLRASPYNRLGLYSDAPVDEARTVGTRQLRLEPRHFGEFRVPGLRQLALTAPYMHDGSLPTLDAVLRHYAELDEDRLHADGQRILVPLHLSRCESADLLAFLLSLSAADATAAPTADSRQCEMLPDSVPSGVSGSGASFAATR